MVDELHRRRVLNFLDAFYAGDVDATLACCADDMVFMVHMPVELFPHLGPRRGKQAVAEMVELHVARYRRRSFDVGFMMAEPTRAAAILDLSFKKRGDGRVMQFSTGNFFRLRRGLITEMRCFFDTIDMIEQLTGRDLVATLLRESGSALQPPRVLMPVGGK